MIFIKSHDVCPIFSGTPHNIKKEYTRVGVSRQYTSNYHFNSFLIAVEYNIDFVNMTNTCVLIVTK